MSQIHTAILGVMEDIGPIGKNQKNIQQNFMYRGVDGVMNALQPVLVKHRVYVVPEVLEKRREERQTVKGGNLLYSIVTMRYTFYAEDGSSVSATVIGEGMDSGDKATNKAMSVAFKYACFQVFCIPTEEMHDPDGETPAESRPKDEAAPKQDKIRCADCGCIVTDVEAEGKQFTAEQIAKKARKEYGRPLCWGCALKAKSRAALQKQAASDAPVTE